jgi:acetylornithine aminotransferase
MREAIYDQCMNQHRFAYISSLGGNEISCVVAAKVLDVASSPALLENVRKIGAYLHSAFDALCSKHSDVLKGVTSFGLAVSVQVANRDVGRELYRMILANGVLCHSVAEIDPPGLKFFPPLVLSETEADQIVDALDRAASSLRKSLKPAA